MTVLVPTVVPVCTELLADAIDRVVPLSTSLSWTSVMALPLDRTWLASGPAVSAH